MLYGSQIALQQLWLPIAFVLRSRAATVRELGRGSGPFPRELHKKGRELRGT